MGFLNRKKPKKTEQTAHLNWMGGSAWDLQNPLQRLRIAASSCFFGEPQYYQRDAGDKRPLKHQAAHRLQDWELDYLRSQLQALDPREWRNMSPAELMEQAIDAALEHDPEATLKEAVHLRTEAYIRVTPQVILVRAAHHPKVKGSPWIRQYAKQLIQRADEPATGLAYQLARFGKPIPNSLKRAWKDALERFDDYQLSKYRLEGHQVKTLDVVRLVHAQSPSIDKLAQQQLKVKDKTWEGIISAQGASQASWLQALERMGHMALLRNLRNLLKYNVPPTAFVDKLIAGAKTGKQLPFRYYSAYLALDKNTPPQVLDGLETALMTSLNNLPTFRGRVISLCDNSGSATGTTTSSLGKMRIASIANLTGVLTGMVSDEGHLGIFGDRLETFAIRKKSSVFDQVQKADQIGSGIGGGTEHGIWLFWEQAIRRKEHWDMVFIYSDMQAGHGGLFGDPKAYKDYQWNKTNYIDIPKLVSVYRQQVNAKVLVFLVQVAGYQDTIMPEFYHRTYILGGWGEGLLRFAAQMAQLEL